MKAKVVHGLCSLLDDHAFDDRGGVRLLVVEHSGDGLALEKLDVVDAARVLARRRRELGTQGK